MIRKQIGSSLKIALAIALPVLMLIPTSSVSADPPQYPEMISRAIDGSGNQADKGAGDWDYKGTQISDDGRYVGFLSRSTNLGPYREDHTGVYVHDRQQHTTTLVSVGTNGVQEDGDVLRFELSGDGKHVAFVTYATNLDPAGGDYTKMSTYVRNLVTNTTVAASLDNSGQRIYGGQYLSITDDGSKVAFMGAPNTGQQYVRDLIAQTTTTLPDGQLPLISGDGSKVLFTSRFGTDMFGSPNSQAAIFDMPTGNVEPVSVAPNGDIGNTDAAASDISDDGRYAVFSTISSNILPGSNTSCEPNFCARHYRRDLVAGSTQRIDVTETGAQYAGKTYINNTSISGDGNIVAFTYTSTDENGLETKPPQVAVRNFSENTTVSISNNAAGQPADRQVDLSNPGLSADGSWIVFATGAPNFGVVNEWPQVFLTSTNLPDLVKPVIDSATWTANPLVKDQTTKLSVSASDIGSGVQSVSYSLDGGSAKPLTLNTLTGKWEATFGDDLAINTFNISIIAKDQSGNVSSPFTDVLVTYNPANNHVSGHARFVPSASAKLPIPLDEAQGQAAARLSLGFTGIKPATLFSSPTGSFDMSYVVEKGQNEFSISSTSITSLYASNTTQATLVGRGTMTVISNGQTTVTQNVTVRFELTAGNSGGPNHVTARIYLPGLNLGNLLSPWTINDNISADQSRILIKP